MTNVAKIRNGAKREARLRLAKEQRAFADVRSWGAKDKILALLPLLNDKDRAEVLAALSQT